MRRPLTTLLALLACCAAPLAAVEVQYNIPAFDKWMYGNVPGSYSGTRDVAPVFSILNTSDEDRLGQMLIAFNTGANIPKNLGAENYLIHSVRLRLTITDDDLINYDPTYDSFRSYLDPADPLYQADTDDGRPLEVYGIGLRNGYLRLSGSISGTLGDFHENSPFGSSAVHGRNAYPLSFDAAGNPLDVSDNISERFEATPFGTATAAGIAPGDDVPGETEFIFELAIHNPHIQLYLREALNAGILGLAVSSLHAAEGQFGPQQYPIFFTKENLLSTQYAPKLQINYALIPEPATATFLLLGTTLLGHSRRRRR